MSNKVFYSIRDLKEVAKKQKISAQLHCQIEAINERTTKNNDPYREVRIADNQNKNTIRAWSNTPAFQQLSKFAPEDFVAINGTWHFSENFGLEVDNWSLRELEDKEQKSLLAGSPEDLHRIGEDYDYTKQSIENINDPRLREIGILFLETYEQRFKRTAAARNYHHARLGGLLEHVAQMLRSAEKLAKVYQNVNIDLLKVGVLLHDCGKMWETIYKENSFSMPHSKYGELLGHISLGIEITNNLWREMMEKNQEEFDKLKPDSESVRLHLLHLIASHHGEFEWGAPVLPKTPEAILLHFIDNIDAKMEMFSEAYKNSNELNDDIFDSRRPLRQKYIGALPKFKTKKNKKTKS